MHDIPDSIETDAEVLMSEAVAHAGDSSPRNFRRLILQFWWDVLDRFTDHFQSSENPILHEFILVEVVLGHSLSIPLNGSD